MIYASSDWHWAHTNIKTFEPCRPENFEEVLTNSHRSILKPEDTWWFLGDLCFGGKANQLACAEAIKSINCKKIMVRGNHDRKLKDSYFIEQCGFEKVYPLYAIMNRVMFTHCPISNGDLLDGRFLETRKQLKTIFNKNACVWNIHGHMHSKVSDDPRCINVSVERTNFNPIPIEQYLCK